MMTFWDYFQSVAIICLVLFAAFYASRLIIKSGRAATWKGSGMRLLGTIVLGKDKAVAIVEIGPYAYILGVGGRRVERLDRLALSELDLTAAPLPTAAGGFTKVLAARLRKQAKTDLYGGAADHEPGGDSHET